MCTRIKENYRTGKLHMSTTSPGTDNYWWATIGWWQLVGGSLWVEVCWWQLVGSNWWVAVSWWQLVGGSFLVAVGWWKLVGGSLWVAVGARRRGDARAYIRPPGECQALRPPRKSQRRSGRDLGTRGRASDPLECTKRCACHANHSGTAPAAPGRRQRVHPTPWSAPSAAPAMQVTAAHWRRQQSPMATGAQPFFRPRMEQSSIS